MRTLYDSTSAADVPADGDLYAAYVDGRYANLAAYRKRFPHKTIVTITVTGQSGANVADCETGDLTPASAARWAKGEINAGRHPTVYCSASQWPVVKAALRSAGVRKVSWWIADYDGKAAVPAGAVAKQYLGSPGNSPGHYDVSAVLDHWPGVDPQAHGLSVTTRAALHLIIRRAGKRKGPLDKAADDLAHQAIEALRKLRAIK